MNSKFTFLLALVLVVIAAPKVEAYEFVTADEAQSVNISCPGKISIAYATYGNRDKKRCTITTYDEVSNSCDGKQTCSFLAANSSFGGQDPCPGMKKSLNVNYECI